jgi:hypothetical protein
LKKDILTRGRRSPYKVGRFGAAIAASVSTGARLVLIAAALRGQRAGIDDVTGLGRQAMQDDRRRLISSLGVTAAIFSGRRMMRRSRSLCSQIRMLRAVDLAGADSQYGQRIKPHKAVRQSTRRALSPQDLAIRREEQASSATGFGE